MFDTKISLNEVEHEWFKEKLIIIMLPGLRLNILGTEKMLQFGTKKKWHVTPAHYMTIFNFISFCWPTPITRMPEYPCKYSPQNRTPSRITPPKPSSVELTIVIVACETKRLVSYQVPTSLFVEKKKKKKKQEKKMFPTPIARQF